MSFITSRQCLPDRSLKTVLALFSLSPHLQQHCCYPASLLSAWLFRYIFVFGYFSFFLCLTTYAGVFLFQMTFSFLEILVWLIFKFASHFYVFYSLKSFCGFLALSKCACCMYFSANAHSWSLRGSKLAALFLFVLRVPGALFLCVLPTSWLWVRVSLISICRQVFRDKCRLACI